MKVSTDPPTDNTTNLIPSTSELHSTKKPPSLTRSESSFSSSDQATDDGGRPTRGKRPKLKTRESSGTMIVHRDSPNLEIRDEVFDEDDARAMSPRRSSKEVEQMGEEVRRDLQEQAKTLQAGLVALLDRVEVARMEYHKLEGENKFLQSYIGELMATSKITSTGAGRSKGGRAR
ncbi:MAG: hypothetical protein M1816_006844 [Peltula sp. TS41687]|nr:MAG: hypothetical protein M1816_006844 [Peltula sp. TS41687]